MTRPIDAKTQAGAGKPSSGNSATTAQDRARTARGVCAARVVLGTMWGHAAGKFSLIVLGLWLASSAVSLVWTPYSLWSTDGYHVWAKRRATTGWEPTAPVRRVQLVAGRLPHQPADRRADRGRRCGVRTGHRGVDGVQTRGAFGGIGGRRRRADIHSHGADRADSRRAARSVRGRHRDRVRIRIRVESGARVPPSGDARREFVLCRVGAVERRFGTERAGAHILQINCQFIVLRNDASHNLKPTKSIMIYLISGKLCINFTVLS